jgi:hypothetical protein
VNKCSALPALVVGDELPIRWFSLETLGESGMG